MFKKRALAVFRRLGATPVLFMAAFIASSSSGQEIEVPSPESLGFEVRAERLSGAESLVRYRDRQSGRTLSVVYSGGEIVRTEETTALGRVVARTSQAGRRLTREQFGAERLVDELEHSPAGSGFARTVFRDGRGHTVFAPWRSVAESDYGTSCIRELNPGEVSALSTAATAFSLPALEQSASSTRAGAFVISNSCSGYAQGAANPSGIGLLTADIEDGLKKGLSCLVDTIGPHNPAARMAAARLMALMNSQFVSKSILVGCTEPGGTVATHAAPMTVTGTASAMAMMCPNAGHPAIGINLAETRKSGGRVNSSFFHEMLHAAGYPHDDAVDWPYLAASCCLYEGPAQRAEACRILKDGNNGWSSDEYQKSFARYMGIQRGHHGRALASAFRSVVAREHLQPPQQDRRKASGLWASASLLFSNVSSGSGGMMAMILGRAAIDSLPAGERQAALQKLHQSGYLRLYPGAGNVQKRSFMESLGSVIGEGMRDGGGSFADRLNTFISVNRQFCPSMSAEEKAAINEAAGIADYRMPKHEQAAAAITATGWPVICP